MRHCAAALVFLGCLGTTPTAVAQTSSPSLTLEVASDERRRGLSWSDGDPVLRASLFVPVTERLAVDATAVSLWGGSRQGGADAVIDLRAGYDRQIGGWRLSGDLTYRLFPGVAGWNYVEAGAAAGFLIGPASLDLSVRYAPRQRSIGGDNLHIGATPSFGIPGTAFTLSANLGHSSGAVRDPIRVQRLRPDGGYWDHGLAIDYRKGRWLTGLRYTNTDIAREKAEHVGATLVARAGVEF